MARLRASQGIFFSRCLDVVSMSRQCHRGQRTVPRSVGMWTPFFMSRFRAKRGDRAQGTRFPPLFTVTNRLGETLCPMRSRWGVGVKNSHSVGLIFPTPSARWHLEEKIMSAAGHNTTTTNKVGVSASWAVLAFSVSVVFSVVPL